MSDKITYSELVDLVAEATGKPKQFVTDFVQNLVDIINEGLERDGKVRLGGFGIFELHNIPETTGTNPRTGEPIPIAAHTRVAFRAANAIEKHVNRSYAHMPTDVIEKPASEPDQGEVEEAVETGEPTEATAEPTPVAEPVPETPPVPAVTPVERPTPPVPRKRSRRGDLVAAAAVLVAALIIAYSFYGGSMPEVSDKFTGLKESLTNRWAEFRAEDSTTVDLSIADADSTAGQYIYPVSDSMEVTTVAKLELGEEPGGVLFAGDELYDVEPSVPMTTHTIPAPKPPITRYRQENAIQYRVGAGDHLWNLAEEHYHEPLFWVHIYGANKARIDDPDSLPPGEIITIPAFDGSPGALTIRDSVNLSMGALQAYEAYKDRNLEWSAYYLRMSRRYQPAAVTAGAH
ncbi:MAG: HU family DNA-binding protein [Candidatus Neomarinimicrobiota bacterium]